MIYNWFIGPQSSGSTNWIPFNPHRKAAAVPRESKRSGEEKNRHENQEQIRTTTYNNQQQPPIHNFETLSSSHTNISQIYTYNQPYLEFIQFSIINRSYPQQKRFHGLTLKKKRSFARETGADHGFVLDTFLGKSTGTCPSLAIWEGESLAIKLGHLKSSRTKPAHVADVAVDRMQKPFITMAPCQISITLKMAL